MRTRTAVLTAVAVAVCTLTASPQPGRAAAADAEAGKKVFADNCTACHSATTNQTIAGPGLKGLYKNAKLPGSGRPVNDANVRKQILEGGGGMPGFKGSLSGADVDNLIAYLKTL